MGVRGDYSSGVQRRVIDFNNLDLSGSAEGPSRANPVEGNTGVYNQQVGVLPPRKQVGGQGGRAVAKLLYAAGSVAFACLAVSLAVKSAVAGVFAAVSFSAGVAPLGVPAAGVSLGLGVGAYYSLKLSAHFFREAIRV